MFAGSVDHDVERSYRGPVSGSLLSMGSVMTTSMSGVGQLFYSPRRGAIKTIWGIPDGESGILHCWLVPPSPASFFPLSLSAMIRQKEAMFPGRAYGIQTLLMWN